MTTTGTRAPVTIRHELRPGDLGRIIALHAELYAREYGFGPGFEAYAIETFAEYVRLPHPERHRIWIAEQDGRLVGCIGILGRENGEAQLRWFLVDPALRGQGLGRRLVNEALAFCRVRGCQSVYLWTVSVLMTAAKLYREAGFQITATKPEALLFDQPLIEERYDLVL
jgi:GNAT superfamily N-acetyltransferase